MFDKNTDFPQYRALSNGKAFYRIRSERDFDEIQIMGSRAIWFSMNAKQYPEMLRIQDMLACEGAYEISNFEKFESLLDNYALRHRAV